MKTQIRIVALILALGAFAFTSCKKDDEIAKPVITLTELGLNNSGIGYIGSDLHIEADIVAEGTINTVTVEIHPEGTGNWEFDTTYTEFSGLKNTTFHKHIDIPTTVVAGEYHFHFIVVDMEGNQTVIESELLIEAPTDSVAPIISITSAPSNGQSFANGATISIAGTISDELSLGGIYIGLVKDDQMLADSLVDADNTITMLHFHDFFNPLSYSFSCSIVVGATTDNDLSPDPIVWTAGSYYILVKCKDAFGGNWTYSNHYPIVIN